MSILVDESTGLVVQGITGREGSFHTQQMLEYGTRVVAGVTPGKGGATVCGVPVFDSVREAVEQSVANTSVIYVPAPYAPDAIYEAADAGISLVVCITEGIPVLDMIEVCDYLERKGVRLIGPNCPGLTSPGKSKVGIMPGHIHRTGSIGVVSRSGTLTYEVIYALTALGLGQSTCVGIGGDPIIGSDFVSILSLMEDDPQTQGVVLIGEIGGNGEEQAAAYIADKMTKPVVAFIAGRTAPPGRRMGHAGAIISGAAGTASAKIAALEEVGVPVARQPEEVASLMADALRDRRENVFH
ncbi:MAG: succinate--CoA ligase subunit alpha [Anaerolineae bacterium]|nr:succinate--CoA ligase subunit alpha [Anaerolineae bacterium]